MRIFLRLALFVLLPGLVVTAAPSTAVTPGPPALTVEVVKSGLSIPWDISFLPDGSMLYSERTLKKVHLVTPEGEDRVILDAPAGVWAAKETGIMAVEVAADFATTREFMTCHGYKSSTTQDVRVVRWRLDAARTTATKVKTLLYGLPSTSGHHSGCALVRGGGNALYVGTGDAFTGTTPQDLRSGGGKVLRINAVSGVRLPSNPFASSSNYMTQRIWTYGHRNIQGLARRSDGVIWSAEHGSYRDDEVNLLVGRGNYGWNPVPRTIGDPSYNEGANSPMTDYRLPGDQRSAKWRSGDPTIATSGIDFVKGAGGQDWGSLEGTLAVSALKDMSLRFMRFDAAGMFVDLYRPPELVDTYGRLRAAVMGPDGALYLTTSNTSLTGDPIDKILKVTPTPTQTTTPS